MAPSGSRSHGVVFAVLFCAFLALASLTGQLPYAVPGLYLVASVMAFFAYWIDKTAAQNNRWRISEGRLHLLGLIGGWPGALLAQKTLRHKSKKETFQTAFWATVVLNCCVLGWLFAAGGLASIRSIVGPVA